MPSFTEMKLGICGLCKGERDGECVGLYIYICTHIASSYVYLYT